MGNLFTFLMGFLLTFTYVFLFTIGCVFQFTLSKNRELTESLEVRASFKRRGRPPKTGNGHDRWFKNKQRERNRIEGSFGNGKEHYGLDRVRYSIKDGSEIWVRAGILAMNLKAAVNGA